MGEKFLTVSEACDRLRLARVTIYGWLRSGKLKSVRPGKRWLIPESEIDRFLAYETDLENISKAQEKIDRILEEMNKQT